MAFVLIWWDSHLLRTSSKRWMAPFFDASKLPWRVRFVLKHFSTSVLKTCGKLWLRLLKSGDDFPCYTKKTAAARFLSPSSSRNLAEITHPCSRTNTSATKPAVKFKLFIRKEICPILFVLICFPICPAGPPHHWVMTLTMICCHPAELISWLGWLGWSGTSCARPNSSVAV